MRASPARPHSSKMCHAGVVVCIVRFARTGAHAPICQAGNRPTWPPGPRPWSAVRPRSRSHHRAAVERGERYAAPPRRGVGAVGAPCRPPARPSARALWQASRAPPPGSARLLPRCKRRRAARVCALRLAARSRRSLSQKRPCRCVSSMFPELPSNSVALSGAVAGSSGVAGKSPAAPGAFGASVR